VQHTAPIDGGSSGGPLTNESGALLGVNTMKLRGRENVALAAPGFAVAEVAHHAAELERLAQDAEWKRRRARDACLALVGELGSSKARLRVAEQMLATSLVAREGLASWKEIAPRDPDLAELWKQDPLEAMRVATVMRLWNGARAAGGVDAAEACDRVDPVEWANLGAGDRASFALRMGQGLHSIALRWERGSWRVVGSDLLTPPKTPGLKPQVPKPRTKPKKRPG